MMQLDRFVAVFWAGHYNTYITKNMSIIACISTKFAAAILVTSASTFDKELGTCAPVIADVWKYQAHLFLDAYPKVVIVVIIISVSVYMGYTMVNNSVHPTVNLPQVPANMPDIQLDRYQEEVETKCYVERRNSQAHEFYRVLEKGTKVVWNQEETTTAGAENPPNSGTSGVNNHGPGCLPVNIDTTVFLIAKSALKMNCYLLIFSLSVIPQVVVTIYHQNCSGPEECDNFYYVLNKLFLLRLLGQILPLVIAIFRLYKYKTM